MPQETPVRVHAGRGCHNRLPTPAHADTAPRDTDATWEAGAWDTHGMAAAMPATRSKPCQGPSDSALVRVGPTQADRVRRRNSHRRRSGGLCPPRMIHRHRLRGFPPARVVASAVRDCRRVVSAMRHPRSGKRMAPPAPRPGSTAEVHRTSPHSRLAAKAHRDRTVGSKAK